MKYTKIRETIWQIADDNGVYCTLVKGSSMAVLWDTGFGKQNLKKFVEENIQTDYMVINSHGHPDHTGGNIGFETVYASESAFDEIAYYAKEINMPMSFDLKGLKNGDILDLGSIHGEIVSLAGHTKGSIGLLIREERLLLAGDAMNPRLWMFNYGAMPVRQLKETLEAAKKMAFDTYLCGHSDIELTHKLIDAHLENIRSMSILNSKKSVTLGIDTYESIYETPEARSVIVYSEDLL